MTGIREAQDEAWANKVDKGFNLTDVPLEFCLLQREVSEAFTVWREGSPGLGSELADVAIFTMGLAEMTGVDLAREVDAKLQVDQSRTYTRLPNGTPVKAARTGKGTRAGSMTAGAAAGKPSGPRPDQNPDEKGTDQCSVSQGGPRRGPTWMRPPPGPPPSWRRTPAPPSVRPPRRWKRP